MRKLENDVIKILLSYTDDAENAATETADLKGLQDENSELKKAVKAYGNEVESLKKVVQDKDTEIESLKNELSEKQAVIDTANPAALG